MSENLLTLTPQEKAAARIALQAHAAVSLTPEEKADIRRALQHAVYADPAPVSILARLLVPGRLSALAFAFVLLIAASGSGIVYAAEYALPGDALYGVKIHVNEAVRANLLRTPEEKAQWAVVRLQRRIDELHALEARGMIDVHIEEQVAADIERSADDAENGVNTLPAEAAERAVLRTAVHTALGTDQDDLHRAAHITHVLQALRTRSEEMARTDPSVSNAFMTATGSTAVVTATQVHVESTSEDTHEQTGATVRVDSSASVHIDQSAHTSLRDDVHDAVSSAMADLDETLNNMPVDVDIDMQLPAVH